ncbi:hypothetical protein R0F62_04945 [Wolbachia endosymbiont of Drosophila aff. chauvacae BK-2020]|uniref:hypothetical protein n=1 Tax=unclassified Wolbachia TaxID=2640676 RepID=UPI002936F398|nr:MULTISPECIES: hypothetical protein [unclassified Wolbachia]WOE62481.1 hypothetical protein R0F62_04945 [Wolbachia endosymbiont of Drosophila aff. chauvacae BK-2020]WOE63850.1 hypothetical protein R0F63_05940 [Wolbachia endosymbiont of Zaprionus tsacasi]
MFAKKCYSRFCLKHKGVIPVLDTGIQPFYAVPLKTLYFNVGLATFILTNLISNQNSWIPVSGHWDDILPSGFKSQYSYSKH